MWYVLDDDSICTQQESCNGSPDKTKDALDKGHCGCSESRKEQDDQANTLIPEEVPRLYSENKV